MSHPTLTPDSDPAPISPSRRPDAAPDDAAGHAFGNSRTATLYSAALGPVNPERYLEVFARFDAVGRSLPVWHPAAALVTLNWMVFRRLWSEAAVYLVAMAALLAVCGGLWVFTAGWPVGVRAGLVGALLLLGWLVPGWLGYGLVHRQMRRRVLRAATRATTMDEALRALRWRASSWQRLQVLAVCNALLLAGAWLGGSQCCSSGLPEPLRAAWQVLSGTPDSATPAGANQPATLQAATGAAATAQAPEAVPAPAVQVAAAVAPSDAAVAPPPVAAPKAAPADPPPAASLAAPPALSAAATETATVGANPAASAAPIAAPMSAPVSVPVSRTATQPSPALKPASQRHGVNVGLFAQPDNARRAYERLQQAGLPVTLEVIATPRGERSRVRVGPFDNPEAAQASAQRVRALGLDAVVFSSP